MKSVVHALIEIKLHHRFTAHVREDKSHATREEPIRQFYYDFLPKGRDYRNLTYFLYLNLCGTYLKGIYRYVGFEIQVSAVDNSY